MRALAAIGGVVMAAACLEAPPDGEPVEPDPTDAAAGVCTPFDDRFDGEALEGRWERTDQPGGTTSVASGYLTLDADPAGAPYTYIDVSTRDRWPLAGSTVTAAVTVVWGAANGDAALVVARDGGYVGVMADSRLVGVARDVGAGFEWLCDPCTSYSPALHRFWRIREEAGALHFQVSELGSLWEDLGPPQPVPAGDHEVLLWSECGGTDRVTLLVDRLTVECSE